MPTSATKEFEKASLGEASNGVVGTSTMKGIRLIWSYGIHLKLWGDNLPLTGKRIGLIRTRRRETYFTGRITEELGLFIITINSNIPNGRLSVKSKTRYSNEVIEGFNYLILDNLWIMKTWTQIIKNDIIPPPMIWKKELHSELQNEECLSSLKESRWKTSRRN